MAEELRNNAVELLATIAANPDRFDEMHRQLAQAFHDSVQLTSKLMDIAETFIPLTSKVEEILACHKDPEKRQYIGKHLYELWDYCQDVQQPLEDLAELLIADAARDAGEDNL